MRIMGLDVGEKTIGIAMSDELGWTAQGVEVLRRTSLERDITRLQQIISEYQVEEIVVGLPKNMNGSLGPRAEMIKEFAEILQQTFQLPIRFWDERLTTVSAERTLIEADVSRKKRKQVIDKMAAMLILQGYLDLKR
ncbi:MULTISPECIES: Holliday junction resolvase RuvX [Tepidibacillus]|uniref:Putative pre-16S rRNA nuclease n=1 Tax=Tepidibacillus decaturensis TaxID=1413211 RepID=A0A135L2Q9_9BACI|nr:MULTISPECIES: Holliday junction resolvase RuvX [Tepidibacillus]KXG43133.1 crossover junction endodeoxyribonuclease RuvA [Tepidibacillus decaturensis]GBF10081.1 putative Holliday junction resolvase [Tepidibacillus sp. HK-1]